MHANARSWLKNDLSTSCIYTVQKRMVRKTMQLFNPRPGVQKGMKRCTETGFVKQPPERRKECAK